MTRASAYWDDILDAQDDDQSWRKYQVHYKPAKVGNYKLEEFDIPRRDLWRLGIIRREGIDRDPGWGKGFTRLVELRPNEKDVRDRRLVWMSDTQAEILEHAPAIDKINLAAPLGQCCRVLINGLGIGMIAKAALLHQEVEHVDVVELNPDIVRLVGDQLTADSRVTIHQGDAYEIDWPRGTSWDLAWHDIWPEIDEDNLVGMDRLRRKYKGRVKWQGFWQIDTCKKMLRDTRAMAAGTMSMEQAWRTLQRGGWPE